jgi:hypothetical protein
MIKLKFLCMLLFVVLLLSFGGAAEDAYITVKEMAFCTMVEGRLPVGADSVFSDTESRIYCFTNIAGDSDSTSISHVWYHNDKEKARVELPVRSKSWRTWSSKRLVKGWTGIWRVDVLSSTGKLIRSNEFLVKPSPM